MKYNNKESIGEGIKLGASILFIVNIILGFLLFMSTDESLGMAEGLAGLVFILVTFYICLIIWGFGQLVTNSDRIVKLLEEQKNKEENSKQENNK